MGQLKKLAGQTVIYGASSMLGRVLNYLLVPLYTAVFSPAEYGVVTELYAYVAFLNILYTYGIETAYFRFATKSADPGRYFQLAQTSLLITTLFFSGALWLLSPSIADWLQYPGQGHYIQWLAVILAIDALVAVPFARLRLEGKAMAFATIRLVNIGVNIGLNLFFLVFCPWWLATDEASWLSQVYRPEIGVGYVFLSNLMANALYLLFFGRYFFQLRFRLDREWGAMLLYAAPLLIMGFAGVTNEMLSRALLKYWLPEGFYPGQTSQEALGIFGACYKLSVFMTLAVQAFRYAFEPFFFSRATDQGSPVLFAKVMHAFVLFGCAAWMSISFFLPEIAPVFLRSESYLNGLEIVPWLLGGGLFLGIYFNLSVWYKLTDKTAYGAWITTFGAGLTIILNYFLIPVMGYLGSAVATLAVYFAMSVISFWLGQKNYPIPYHTAKGLFYIIFAGLSIAAVYFWPFNQLVKYFIATGLLVLFGSLAWWLDIRRGTFN